MLLVFLCFTLCSHLVQRFSVLVSLVVYIATLLFLSFPLLVCRVLDSLVIFVSPHVCLRSVYSVGGLLLLSSLYLLRLLLSPTLLLDTGLILGHPLPYTHPYTLHPGFCSLLRTHHHIIILLETTVSSHLVIVFKSSLLHSDSPCIFDYRHRLNLPSHHFDILISFLPPVVFALKYPFSLIVMVLVLILFTRNILFASLNV